MLYGELFLKCSNLGCNVTDAEISDISKPTKVINSYTSTVLNDPNSYRTGGKVISVCTGHSDPLMAQLVIPRAYPNPQYKVGSGPWNDIVLASDLRNYLYSGVITTSIDNGYNIADITLPAIIITSDNAAVYASVTTNAAPVILGVQKRSRYGVRLYFNVPVNIALNIHFTVDNR